jgi:hypothetical protein
MIQPALPEPSHTESAGALKNAARDPDWPLQNSPSPVVEIGDLQLDMD